MKIYANEQVFQTIYINPEAQDANEKIVFIEPYFESLPPAVIQLKTVKHDPKHGIVISGSESDIQAFRSKAESYDNEHGLGGYPDDEIIKNLVTVAREDMNLTLEYIQEGGQAYQPKEEENALAYLFRSNDCEGIVAGSFEALAEYSTCYLQRPKFNYEADLSGDTVIFTIQATLKTVKKVKKDSYKTHAHEGSEIIEINSKFIEKRVEGKCTVLETYLEVPKSKAHAYAKALKQIRRRYA